MLWDASTRHSPQRKIPLQRSGEVPQQKSGTQVSLTLAGFGPEEALLRREVARRGLEATVDLVGYVRPGEELHGLYDRHDLLVMPSLTEGMPRVVVEAFARGLAVLATPVGALPHLFPEEVAFVKGFDAGSLLEGILWAESHRAAISAMARAGRSKLERFDIAETARRVHLALRTLSSLQ